MGPNGAGKTTLLKILATVILPDHGQVEFGPYRLGRDDEKVRASLGIVLNDERSFYWRLTGRQNLEFFAALYGLNKSQTASRIRELGQHFRIPYLDQRFDSYSTGMRRACALLRAFIHNPPCLLLDEPTRSLDENTATLFKTAILDLRRQGRTILLVTHDLREADMLADTFVVLKEGRVVAVQPQSDKISYTDVYQQGLNHA